MAQEKYTLAQAEEDIADLRGGLDRLGEMLYTVGAPGYLDNQGLQMTIPGDSGASFPAITATSAAFTTIASGVMPANDPVVNGVYCLEVWGTGTWGSTGQVLTLQNTIGGVTSSNGNVQIGAGFVPTSQAVRWHCRCWAFCQTTGPSGTFQVAIDGQISAFNNTLLGSGGTNPANASLGFVNGDAGGTETVDTTTATTLALQAEWASTTGSPVIESRQAIFFRYA
jgi:hypothetical protein